MTTLQQVIDSVKNIKTYYSQTQNNTIHNKKDLLWIFKFIIKFGTVM